MGRNSTNGMSGNLSTPRGRALEDWFCRKLEDGSLFKQPHYPRGVQPLMTIAEMKALAAAEVERRTALKAKQTQKG